MSLPPGRPKEGDVPLGGTARSAKGAPSLLTVEGLVVGYGPADEVLKGVDFSVETGEIVGIIGPNGAGKSTLLKSIAGLLKPGRGSIRLDGESLGGRAPRDISRLGVAYVPQEQNIFPTMSVRENLEMGGYIDPAGTRRKIDTVFERFPILAERRRVAARALSGGERQMLAMAMALMVDPRLLLLDEPSAGLSPLAAEFLFENIVAVNRSGRFDRHGGAECARSIDDRPSGVHSGRRTQPPRRARGRAGSGPGHQADLSGRLTSRPLRCERHNTEECRHDDPSRDTFPARLREGRRRARAGRHGAGDRARPGRAAAARRADAADRRRRVRRARAW